MWLCSKVPVVLWVWGRKGEGCGFGLGWPGRGSSGELALFTGEADRKGH